MTACLVIACLIFVLINFLFLLLSGRGLFWRSLLIFFATIVFTIMFRVIVKIVNPDMTFLPTSLISYFIIFVISFVIWYLLMFLSLLVLFMR
jgi:hypothetical protein